MALKVSDVGGQLMLNVLFGATAKTTSFSLQLITDAGAAADSDINTTHTVAAGGGYAGKTLTNDATVALASGIPEAVWATQTWTFTGALTGPQDITGYQVLSGTTLLWVEKFAIAFTPVTNGDQLALAPKFKLGNGTPE